MCLGIPVKIIEKRKDTKALVEYKGVRQEVDLRLTPKAEVGDYVVLHAGFSIEQVDSQQAKETHRIIEDLK